MGEQLVHARFQDQVVEGQRVSVSSASGQLGLTLLVDDGLDRVVQKIQDDLALSFRLGLRHVEQGEALVELKDLVVKLAHREPGV